jgi:hypothetical protein
VLEGIGELVQEAPANGGLGLEHYSGTAVTC